MVDAGVGIDIGNLNVCVLCVVTSDYFIRRNSLLSSMFISNLCRLPFISREFKEEIFV